MTERVIVIIIWWKQSSLEYTGLLLSYHLDNVSVHQFHATLDKAAGKAYVLHSPEQ